MKISKLIFPFLICFIHLGFSQRFISVSPTEAGFKKSFFSNFSKKALKEIPSLASIIVYKENAIVFEEYYNNTNSQTLFQVKSVTKSVVSSLAGIAKDQGKLPELSTSLLSIFPEYTLNRTSNPNVWYSDFLAYQDSIRKLLTVKDLLTMQSGYLWDDNNPMVHRPFQTSSDPVRYILELPFENEPGTTFKYNTGASHLLGAVISKYVQMDLKQFADSFLFHPIGIYNTKWTSDPMGRTAGGAELSLTARNMLQFGQLILNSGNFNGEQIISKGWLDEATKAQVVLNEWDVLPNANGYGYYWWRRKSNGHQVIVASGYGGQLICIIPDLKMIVTTTCLVNEKNRGRSEIKRLHLLIDKIVKASNK